MNVPWPRHIADLGLSTSSGEDQRSTPKSLLPYASCPSAGLQPCDLLVSDLDSDVEQMAGLLLVVFMKLSIYVTE